MPTTTTRTMTPAIGMYLAKSRVGADAGPPQSRGAPSVSGAGSGAGGGGGGGGGGGAEEGGGASQPGESLMARKYHRRDQRSGGFGNVAILVP